MPARFYPRTYEFPTARKQTRAEHFLHVENSKIENADRLYIDVSVLRPKAKRSCPLTGLNRGPSHEVPKYECDALPLSQRGFFKLIQWSFRRDYFGNNFQLAGYAQSGPMQAVSRVIQRRVCNEKTRPPKQATGLTVSSVNFHPSRPRTITDINPPETYTGRTSFCYFIGYMRTNTLNPSVHVRDNNLGHPPLALPVNRRVSTTDPQHHRTHGAQIRYP
ncbi:hypothetical protein BDP55DRAFT_634166 [Colletotrichum godetiae]|uniref:Uncharacterized protein n=1 Tax=Colletotrichum godetiae TaxID=1209918 RepID=A0AAJ0AH69_9PEZI|nr:uncharacterized protein BDP55DRAFT_634166 [Colletotrichum godetiae]KAK1673220.1 hypothetical protein BDP55DRAFT_634166 [Colletotrichum godetiae]